MYCSATVELVEDKKSEMDSSKVQYRSKKKRRSVAVYVPKFGCFKSDDQYPTDGDGSFEMECSACRAPTHLVVTVNGIIGSAQNWRFAAKQFMKKYPQDVIVHCSECNSSMLTFDGVDVMGNRLADEDGESRLDGSGDSCPEEKLKGNIAGLEPVNFITSATPHLGLRGHKQVPAFCGFYTLEKVAFRASWFLGRTGKHLFLADTDNGQPPLLLQMVKDSEDLPFMSALHSFKRRVAYANARFDHIVGWSTSSLRRRNELPKRQHLSRNDKYPHIVNVEAATQETASLEAPANGYQSDDIEETMIRGLTKVSWERVDVSFSGSKQKYFAHSTIQVKTYCVNSDGADVIQHMIDNFLL